MWPARQEVFVQAPHLAKGVILKLQTAVCAEGCNPFGEIVERRFLDFNLGIVQGFKAQTFCNVIKDDHHAAQRVARFCDAQGAPVGDRPDIVRRGGGAFFRLPTIAEQGQLFALPLAVVSLFGKATGIS